jgi:hypothetical protein
VKVTPWILFDGLRPGLDTARGLDGTPFFIDGTTVAVATDRSAFGSYPQQAAVLLLHHMNRASDQVEIVRFRPRLSLTQTGGDLMLSWPDPGPFTLQAATGLSAPVAWTDIASVTNRYQVPRPETGARFFRLKAPNPSLPGSLTSF